MKKLLLIGLGLAIIGSIVGYQMYNKPHEDIRSAQADVDIQATALFSAYEADENTANTEYLDKKIQVSGTVMKVETDDAGKVGVTLNAGGMLGGVVCKLDDLAEHKRTEFAEGEEVTFKGICTGMLMDVVLERCVEL